MGQPTAIGLATVKHLANHINTSLTKIKHCRFWRGKPSGASSSEDDEFVSDWNFLVVIYVITTNTTVKMN
jgi:hypothetical protein